MMASELASLFPGVDLCAIPGGTPPDGQVSNFDDPTTLMQDLTISLTVIPTFLAIFIASGRLWANFKRRTWSDGDYSTSKTAKMPQKMLTSIFDSPGPPCHSNCCYSNCVKYYRHIWDVPLCWLNDQFFQLAYAYETITTFGLLFAKTTTLLLFHQLFHISRQLRLAIQVGIAVNFLLYGISIAVLTYYSTPHIGQTWDDVVTEAVLHRDIFVLKWSVGQATSGAALDIYIFILPLPTISRLNLFIRKRIQLMAVFFIAVLVKSLSHTDSTWNAGILMICVQIELTVAIIVCPMPGFAGFMRTSVSDSKLASTLGSLLGNITRSGSPDHNRNQPHLGKYTRHFEQKIGYPELNETWLMDSRPMVSVEHHVNPPQPVYEGLGGRFQNSVDIEQQSWASSEGSGRGFIFH
ncbi:hypothetical protein N8I77_004793 [Diaporthe amygdali]|uniref:Rhodopsin domain-containing protein n=1 Tax=Phomopsis amygdali TaxID=1214568 RepID=A0AAD9W7D7_PHOAM|nr:hypothetical protein N8I77_004793 [Diaporthe amygdali]